VLTIFEYLRKLARESVLSGVQDAVEYLGGKPSSDSRNVADRSQPTEPEATPPVGPRFNAQNYLKGPGPAPSDQPDGLPPPRRRGRPPKTGESA
jgi:hypothetical protein